MDENWQVVLDAHGFILRMIFKRHLKVHKFKHLMTLIDMYCGVIKADRSVSEKWIYIKIKVTITESIYSPIFITLIFNPYD